MKSFFFVFFVLSLLICTILYFDTFVVNILYCMTAKYRFNVRDFTKRAYEAYFGLTFGDQDKS